MAHDGTNHPWYQGFTNIFGNINQGFQNAMQSPTQNVTRQDFLADWFRQQGQIADNGMFDIQGFMSTNDAGEQIFDPVKFRTKYMDGDPNAAIAMVLGEEAYKDSKLQDKGKMNELMNNPAFMMGLNLMGQAAQGKGIQEALAPSMTATQAFMTNQELRKQNKRLSMNKDGTISEAMDAAVKRKIDLKTATAGSEMAQMQADTYMESFNAKMVNLGLSNDAQKLNNELMAATMDDKKQISKATVTKYLQGIEKGEFELDILATELKFMEPMKAAKLENALLANEGLSETNQQLVLKTKSDRIALLNDQNELELDRAWQEQVDNMTGFTDAEKQIMKEGGAKSWLALSDNNTISQARSDYVNNHKSSIRESVGYKLLTTGEDKENRESLVDDAVISAAIKIAKVKGRTEPIRSDYLAAEEQVFSDFGLSKNSALFQLFGGAKFTQNRDENSEQIINVPSNPAFQFLDSIFGSPYKAMGGPVQAGKPYIVGEQGPEVMVPNQDGNIVSNPGTKGGYNWEDAIIDNSEMLKKIKQTNGRAEAVKALKKFRPDLYV